MENERYAAELLRVTGMSPKYKGYAYILYMLRLSAENPLRTQNVSLQLYTAVCAHFQVSPTVVERNVRFAIRRCWEADTYEKMRRLFQSYGVCYIPTNREYICIMTDCMLHGGVPAAMQRRMW